MLLLDRLLLAGDSDNVSGIIGIIIIVVVVLCVSHIRNRPINNSPDYTGSNQQKESSPNNTPSDSGMHQTDSRTVQAPPKSFDQTIQRVKESFASKEDSGTRQVFNSKRPGTILELIGSVLIIIGTFSPAYSIAGFSGNGVKTFISQGDGLFHLLIIAFLLVSLFNNMKRGVLVAFILEIIMFLLSTMAVIGKTQDSFGLAEPGPGLAMLFIGNLCLLIGTVKLTRSKN